MSKDRRRDLYAALARATESRTAAELETKAGFRVPLAKGRVRERLEAAEEAGDGELVSELKRLIEELDRAFPD